MSEPSPELFLILHKVRGEPTFDVATYIGDDGDGEVWIIPTSGHRCYPLQSWPIPEEVVMEADAVKVPIDWPDHYTASAADEGYGHKELRKYAVTDLLNRLGLNRKPSLTRRLPK